MRPCVAAVHVVIVGWPRAFPAELWLYVGGPVSVIYIFLSAALVAQTGVLLLGLGAVVGQLLTSIAIDATWPAPAIICCNSSAADPAAGRQILPGDARKNGTTGETTI